MSNNSFWEAEEEQLAAEGKGLEIDKLLIDTPSSKANLDKEFIEHLLHLRDARERCIDDLYLKREEVQEIISHMKTYGDPINRIVAFGRLLQRINDQYQFHTDKLVDNELKTYNSQHFN